MSGPGHSADAAAAIAAALGQVLDTLCPMHVLLDATGHVRHAGPALAKLRPGAALEGRRLLEMLELRRPRSEAGMAGLLGLAGKKLHFVLRDPPRTELKGVLVALPDSLGLPGGAVLNLSFGLSIVEAVQDYHLTGADFAATDLAIELLYLVEAKSAAMEELRRLNRRLDGARAQAEQAAFTDRLTGLGNRRMLEIALDRLVQAEQPFALMHCDLDRFKQVNDGFGHAAGDRVLQAVAERLGAATRERDTLIRYGGDEFLLLLPDPGGPDEMARLGARLIAAIEAPVRHEGQSLNVSASIGACLSTDYRQLDVARMMRDADAALYAAKAAGRGRYVHHAPDAGDAPDITNGAPLGPGSGRG
ncbi:MAG: GGDEF domain-containing protein [Roseovarius sp.]